MKHSKTKKTKLLCSLSRSILLILFFSTYTNYAVAEQTGIIIKGNITNIPSDSSNLVHLYSYYGSELSEIDSAVVNEQGNFKLEFKGTLQNGLYKIGLDSKNAATIVLSDENEISINADYAQLKADNITVTDSRENEAYRALLNEWKRMGDSMASLNIEKSQISTVDPFYNRKIKAMDGRVRSLMQEHNVHLLYIKEAYADTFTAEVLVNLSLLPLLTDHPNLSASYDNERAFMHDYFFEFVDFDDERIIYTPFLTKKYLTYLDKYTHHTAEGFKDSVDLILGRSEANNAVREFTIQYLIDAFNNRGPVNLADYVMDNYVDGCSAPLSERTVEKIENIKRLRVGQIAPEIISKGPDGNTIALSSLIGKGVLLVYFWASWCDGCEAENPNIVKLYNKYRERGLDIYAIALETDKTEWLSAIKKHRFTWTNVSDLRKWESEAAKTYNVNKTPSIYILDKKGIIMAKNLRENGLERKIEELLNWKRQVKKEIINKK